MPPLVSLQPRRLRGATACLRRILA